MRNTAALIALVATVGCSPPSVVTVDVDGRTVIRANGGGLTGSNSSALCTGYYRDDNAPRASGFLLSAPGWKVSFTVADGHTRPTGTFVLGEEGAPYQLSLTHCAESDGCGLFDGYLYSHVAGGITITNSTDRLVGGGTFVEIGRASCRGRGQI